MKNVIKFSHRYLKFDTEELPAKATLLHVFVENTKNLHEKFIEYDTVYITRFGKRHYELPEGLILVLLLKSEESVFTTIRRHTPQKEVYYHSKIGEEFEIKIEGEFT